MLKKIYDILKLDEVLDYKSPDDFITMSGFYNNIGKSHEYSYYDLIDILINATPEYVDKDDPLYSQIKGYMRAEDYFYCSSVYTNILRCINYKSDNPNKITKIEWVDVHPVNNQSYITDFYTKIRFNTKMGINITLSNLYPDNISTKSFYISKLFEYCKIAYNESENKKYKYYHDINQNLFYAFRNNIEHYMKWYLEKKFELNKVDK